MDDTTANIISQGLSLGNVWRHELLLVDENSIRVSNIIIAIIMVLIGLSFSGKLSKWLENLYNKASRDKDTNNILHKLTFYSLVVFYVITILEIANIPLNIFAFIGGALAISAGLGAKQLLNNLISGILMIVEKPVKIGDIIQISDVVGQVESIGARSTIIKQINGPQIVVPNSSLMQNNLSNWSHNSKNLLIDVVIKTEIKNGTSQECEDLKDKIAKAVKSIDILEKAKKIDISLFAVDKSEGQFLLSIEIQEKNINKIILIKNELNFALVEQFGTGFSTKYPPYLNQ